MNHKHIPALLNERILKDAKWAIAVIVPVLDGVLQRPSFAQCALSNDSVKQSDVECGRPVVT